MFYFIVMLMPLLRNIFLTRWLSDYSELPFNKKSFIGLNRARRPHNAIFVSFTDPTVPAECLEAASLNWTRVCLKECDKQAEERMKKVCVLL